METFLSFTSGDLRVRLRQDLEIWIRRRADKLSPKARQILGQGWLHKLSLKTC